MNYFPEPYIHSKNRVKNKVHLSNYAIKTDLKGTTHIDNQNLLKRLI